MPRLGAKKSLEIMVKTISEENADGREMLTKLYVTIKTSRPGRG